MKWARAIYDRAVEQLFLRQGMRPWSRGYSVYKERIIRETLREGSFATGLLPAGYGFRLDERIIEYPWLFANLPPDQAGFLLDAGSVLNFEYILNLPSLEKKKLFISTLAPERDCFWNRGVSYVYEDLRNSCFKDGYFDWIVSLSTIEHIGLDNTMLYTSDGSKKEESRTSYLEAVKEYKRMLKPGGILYLSVPFGQRRNHGWFQIFDAQMLDQVIAAFEPNQMHETHYKYEPDGWHLSSREESKGATYFDIHAQSTYDADYAAASRAVVCLELVK